jgi:lipoprotein-releasing system ATP-binding protein
VPVLRGVSLEVAAGDSIAITGPSGCGKSTLLHLIGALDRPTSGTILLGGQDLAQLNEAEACRIRRERMGFIFQQHALLPQCTALQNVMLPVLATRGASEADEARARELLERLGLAARADHVPARLSGGECQRVAFARALMLSPMLVLADEPTGSLDEANAAELTDQLLQLNRELGTTLIVVTHSPDVAARMGRNLKLRHGVLE